MTETQRDRETLKKREGGLEKMSERGMEGENTFTHLHARTLARTHAHTRIHTLNRHINTSCVSVH
jgi:hypothetical protein